MSQFPLQLNYYFITNLSLKANPNAIGDHGDIQPILADDLNVQFGFFDADEDGAIQCNLSVSSIKELAYEFSVEIVGFFLFEEDLTESEKKNYLINAPATLFGIAREKLASLSADGPHTKIILPMVDARVFQSDELELSIPKMKLSSKKSTAKKKTTRKKS
ncbi:MAG: protein-export chaperone SecB [Candidatus Hinthialibacter antarcticus]|nr:protein-export chaperone SecB [Candidatus Hinthialibacter antarcticus]